MADCEHTDALFDYDGSVAGMRRIVRALFAGERWYGDDADVSRRHELSIAPGAWEAIAAARFHRPQPQSAAVTRGEIAYRAIAVPTLVVSGAEDKLKPQGWTDALCAETPELRHTQIPAVGHCAQTEDPDAVLDVLRPFLAG